MGRTPPHATGLYDPRNEHDACGVGMVAHIKGAKSHAIVTQALEILANLDHRGAVGADPLLGDGAGILLQVPDPLLRKWAESHGHDLPQPGDYAVAMCFLPQQPEAREFVERQLERFAEKEGQRVVGWRDVPTTLDGLGKAVVDSMPVIRQCVIARGEGCADGDAFERKLVVIRKQTLNPLAALEEKHGIPGLSTAYIPSFSSRTVVYKGLLLANQVGSFYDDLRDPDCVSALGLVHQRFSTNTFPSWRLAHPYRFMAHNGEINTVRGNVNWMEARRRTMESELLGSDLDKMWPLIPHGQSDTACLDNALELLLTGGYSLAHAMMMLMPEAWAKNPLMDPARRAFYEYHAALMEPWDGPAAVCFTDGRQIGACLDRNGLRPARWCTTKDDLVVLASESGVLPFDDSEITRKWRLQPGRMLLIDLEQGRIVEDEELKADLANAEPYEEWLKAAQYKLKDLDHIEPELSETPEAETSLLERQQAFGYTQEDIARFLEPMARGSEDPIGSMGTDTPIAVLSDRSRLLYDYFKQNFAQVTNPPIDSIREEVVMSLRCFIGPEGNLLETTPEQVRRLSLEHPVLSNQQLTDLSQMDHKGLRSCVIDITFPANQPDGFMEAVERICREASQAIEDGYAFIILSDRNISQSRIPLSALIATGAVHQHLLNNELRSQIGIVVETGEAREVHHHCLLTGYGADAVNPYLAFEALWQANKEGLLGDNYSTEDSLVAAYKKGVAKGMMKVMAKMGISTLQSYKGAQIFEAVGLADEIIAKCFAGTASRVQGVNFSVLSEESRRRHAIGYPEKDSERIPVLNNPGDFHWRTGGDAHMWNPNTIFNLQLAARNNSADAYAEFARHVNEQATRQCTLRGLMKLRTEQCETIPLEEVEPASEIVKRFATGAMSFGSISQESHESLAVAMNRLGGKSNTGEGGEDPERFTPMANGDSKRSAIKQVASGRFGVTAWYLTNADELQIKIAQGAKPGEGGELPGGKVDEQIARIRHSTPGVGLISPPPHHDIYSIEDIAQLIHDLKNANREARISVKLVSEIGVGTIAAGVTKAKTDHLVIAGHDGGTGASPLTSIKHAGLPWELGVAETHQTLVMNNLRSRVTLQTDGQLKTGRDIAIATLLGAEEYGFSTAPLITLGCIMMRKCHLNTCPVGIATQDPELRKKFKGEPEHVVNYLFMVAEELRSIMAELGLRTVNEMIGRVDLLDADAAIDHWKASGLDLSRILEPAKVIFENTEFYRTQAQDHGLEKALDNELIRRARPALEKGETVHIEHEVININRVVGTMLSNEVCKRFGADMLPDDTINIKLKGSAGQSLGAWLAKGITLTVEGDANDYLGKGLSGGKIILYPPVESTFKAEENIIAGNVILYGATGGEAYIRGIAAERFAVRNSGASAVVEGIGDHGCEYMTGGCVVVLGQTGRNFGAGMSGGIAYVWDPEGEFSKLCNSETFELETLSAASDILELKRLIENHANYTDSSVARAVLENWEDSLHKFVKVMPTDFKRVLAERAATAA